MILFDHVPQFFYIPIHIYVYIFGLTEQIYFELCRYWISILEFL